MTPEQQPEQAALLAPSGPSVGRTALAFVLAAVILVGMALGYRALGRGTPVQESGLAHCFKADFLASNGMPGTPMNTIGGPRSWREAEKEYRLALRSNPRLARAHRGLAAILWLRGDRIGARRLMLAPVDVPGPRKDVWVATETAFGATRRPRNTATIGRYKKALQAEDLGWSRYVALEALASDPSEAARWRAERLRGSPASRKRIVFAGMGGLVSFLTGLWILFHFLTRRWPERLTPWKVPGMTLGSACILGLAVEGLPAWPIRHLWPGGLESAGDLLYYPILLMTHVVGAGLALALVHNFLRCYGESAKALGWKVRGSLTWAVGGYLGLLPLLVIAAKISDAGARLFPNVETPMNSATWIVASARGWSLVFVFLTVCVVGPFVEELLFRGCLYRALSSSFGPVGGAVLSSAVFAALHPQLPLGFLPIMCIGIGLCVIYRYSGSLTACWLCHGINNAVTMLFTLSAFGVVRWP